MRTWPNRRLLTGWKDCLSFEQPWIFFQVVLCFLNEFADWTLNAMSNSIWIQKQVKCKLNSEDVYLLFPFRLCAKLMNNKWPQWCPNFLSEFVVQTSSGSFSVCFRFVSTNFASRSDSLQVREISWLLSASVRLWTALFNCNRLPMFVGVSQ